MRDFCFEIMACQYKQCTGSKLNLSINFWKFCPNCFLRQWSGNLTQTEKGGFFFIKKFYKWINLVICFWKWRPTLEVLGILAFSELLRLRCGKIRTLLLNANVDRVCNFSSLRDFIFWKWYAGKNIHRKQRKIFN